MSVEEIKNCTVENAWELVEFAEAEGIQIQGQDVADLYDHIYDLKDDTDKDSIAEIIGDILKCSDITVVYDYIKQAVEGDSRFVWEKNGFLVPFTENSKKASVPLGRMMNCSLIYNTDSCSIGSQAEQLI